MIDIKPDKKLIIYAVWLFLIICLLFTFPGFESRLENEASNKSVIPAADYEEFAQASREAGVSLSETLTKLSESGVKTLAIRETTLGDLISSGRVQVQGPDEFKPEKGRSLPHLNSAAVDYAGSSLPSTACSLILPQSKEISDFLRKRLTSRFSAEELIIVDSHIPFFILKLDKSRIYRMGLGFDPSILSLLKKSGFDLLLRPLNSPGSGTGFNNELEQVIKLYNVRYIIFDGGEVPGYPRYLDRISELYEENNITLGLIEDPLQVGYVSHKGISEVLERRLYAANRVYVTPYSDLSRLDSDELFYRWLRCVVDRNIRILYISPLKTDGLSASAALDSTLVAVSRLTHFISSKGYSINNPLPRFSFFTASPLHYMLLSLSLVIAAAFFVYYLPMNEVCRLRLLLVPMALTGLYIFICRTVFSLSAPNMLALAASILYPPLSGLLILTFLRNNPAAGLFTKLSISLLLLLTINLIGAYTAAAALYQLKYILSLETYKGVAVSYALPLLVFILLCTSFLSSDKNASGMTITARQPRSTLWHTAAAASAIIIFYIYLSRSGNNSLVPPSAPELRAREILEYNLLARPRFKEFLVGYPSLFCFVYLHHRKAGKYLLLPFGSAMLITGVSIINSFCHVFTPVATSALRTFYGLAAGIAVGPAALSLSACVLAFLERRGLSGIPK